jgi:hypothetical protein
MEAVMMTSMYSKQDLLKTFVPLSDAGKSFLEVLLVNPKSSKIEGRGFFNDSDFLGEACNPLVGRFNFCLSNFAFAAEQVPTRGSYNQFDRNLPDSGLQEQARAHSISIVMLFKPDLIREMASQSGNGDQFLNIVYQIDAILGRLGIKSFSLDYFLTGMVARFRPANLLQRRPLNRQALGLLTKRLLEVMEKEMQPQELKRFALTAAVTGKVSDPLPGLPGLFTGEGQDTVIVCSSGALEPGEDGPFGSLCEEIFDGKKAGARQESYSAPNIQGLSQNWEESAPQYETGPTATGGDLGKGFNDHKSAFPELKSKEGSKELQAHFQALAQNRWRWPLYSTLFNNAHQGVACGELVLMQTDPFAADMGFHYLMQCAESYAKEGTGQILVFSKKRSQGDLALSSLSRHYKANPMNSRQAGKFPEAAGLAQVYGSLFSNAPEVPPCGRAEGIDQLLRYLEHDYLLKLKKHGSALLPLAIVIDNLDEFWQDSDLETFKRLSAFKLRLREFNASLWVTQSCGADHPGRKTYVGLADHLLGLDHDGSSEAAEAGRAFAPRPGEWEATFHLDLSLGKLMHEIALAKVRFQAHGSHRVLYSHYVFYRQAFTFRELHPPDPVAAQGAAGRPDGFEAMPPMRAAAPPGGAQGTRPKPRQG